MLMFNRNHSHGVKIKKLTTPGRFNTYICGWLIEDRRFLAVIDENTLVQIFDKLISLVDLIADELDVRLRENGFTREQAMAVRKNANCLRQVCHNFQSYEIDKESRTYTKME